MYLSVNHVAEFKCWHLKLLVQVVLRSHTIWHAGSDLPANLMPVQEVCCLCVQGSSNHSRVVLTGHQLALRNVIPGQQAEGYLVLGGNHLQTQGSIIAELKEPVSNTALL